MIYVILAYLSYPFIAIFGRSAPLTPGSILVFQTAKIGDMICTSPVFREIKKANPTTWLGAVIDPVTEPLLRHNPYVNEIIIFDRRKEKGIIRKIQFARRLHKKGYSCALILMPNVTNIFSAFWARIPRRISIYPDYAGATLRHAMRLNTGVEYHLSPKMSMETYLQSLRHFGVQYGGLDKEVYPSPGAGKKAFDHLRGEGPFVGIVLGTGNELKDWGRPNFMTLAKMLLDGTSVTIVLLGSDKESTVAREIITSFGDARAINLCGIFTLSEMPAVIKRLTVVVGVDTGLIYMADALNIPLIDIAGPCDMSDQRPLGKQSQIIQEIGIVECIPCSHTFLTPYACRYGHKNCVKEISPEQVFKNLVRNFPVLHGEAGASRSRG